MRKKKIIEKLYSEVEQLKRVNKALDKNRSDLYKKLLEQKELSEKKNRKAILKDYDIAILIKNNKTNLLQKGEEEKTIRSFTLSQDGCSYPVLEIEKVLC